MENNQNLEEWAEEEPDLVALLDDTYFHDTLEDCLEKLPPKWKILIKMCYLEAKKIFRNMSGYLYITD